MNKRMAKKGLTLIELTIVIVIAAVILIPLSVIIVETVRNTVLPEHLEIASALLEGKVEEITNSRFSDIENMVGGSGESGSFTGDLSYYSYTIAAPYYVAASNLNTQVAGPTDYIRVQITISRTGFPDVMAVTLVTDN